LDPPSKEAVAEMSDAERKRYSYFEREESSHFFIKASEPQTLAYGSADSPVGWLAWVMDIFQQGTDNNGDFLTAVNRDAFLTDVTLYWVTNTVGSSMRIYREYRLTGEGKEPQPRVTVPMAFADFPKEMFACPVRWAKPTYNVVQYTRMPKGGHFAALEQPGLLLDDIRKFFAEVLAR
jgi:pimeloyl-ACP methyl ester carboxylesterase